MCTVCGCETTTVEGEKKPGAEKAATSDGSRHRQDDHHDHAHDHDQGPDHDHPHDHDHHHHRHDHARASGGEVIDFGAGIAGVHVPGLSQERIVRIERDILSKNDAYARDNRAAFAAKGVLALNLVSSPGSGKTTLLVRAIEDLKTKVPVAVIEGDQQTSNDADRIRATGAPAIQINTGKGCHLDAHMVGHALESSGRKRAACSSSRTSAISSARRLSISARRIRSWCCR